MSETVQLGDLSDLGDGDVRRIDGVGPHGLMVCRVNGELFALDDRCSHAQVKLSSGRLRGHSIYCPLHGAQFDVRDGSHGGPPAPCPVASHEITETDAGTTVTLTPSEDDGGDPTLGMFRTR